MKYRYLFALILCFIALAACENRKQKIDTSGNITPTVEKNITIFGSENCDHCIEFRKKVDSVRLNYTFKDVEANERFYQELSLKIKQANFKGYVSFPVLEIDDKIYVKPEFEEFLRLVSE